MGTLTADMPRLDEHCPHKLPTSCRLTSTPLCCACADERQHTATYRVYIDGIGFVHRGTRWQSYCWFCKEFWNARVAASRMPISQTRIPERPNQQAFLDRWYDFHRGYRIARLPDGSEQQIAVVGEPLRDVDPGHLPRTLEELRSGRVDIQHEDDSDLDSVDVIPVEPQASLEQTLNALLDEVEAEDEVRAPQPQPRLISTQILTGHNPVPEESGLQPPTDVPPQPPSPLSQQERAAHNRLREARARRQAREAEAREAEAEERIAIQEGIRIRQQRRTATNLTRVFGTREDVQSDEYVSPITSMFTRVAQWGRQTEAQRLALENFEEIQRQTQIHNAGAPGLEVTASARQPTVLRPRRLSSHLGDRPSTTRRNSMGGLRRGTERSILGAPEIPTESLGRAPTSPRSTSHLRELARISGMLERAEAVDAELREAVIEQGGIPSSSPSDILPAQQVESVVNPIGTDAGEQLLSREVPESSRLDSSVAGHIQGLLTRLSNVTAPGTRGPEQDSEWSSLFMADDGRDFLENFDFDAFLHDTPDTAFEDMDLIHPAHTSRHNLFFPRTNGEDPSPRETNTALPPPPVNGMQRRLEIGQLSGLLTRLQIVLHVMLNRPLDETSQETNVSGVQVHPLIGALEHIRDTETRESLGVARSAEWTAIYENALSVTREYLRRVTELSVDGTPTQIPQMPHSIIAAETIPPEDMLSHEDTSRALQLISGIQRTWTEHHSRQMRSIASLFQNSRGLDSDDRPAEPATEEAMTAKLSCKICYCQVADTACLPCGHLSMCRWCADLTVPVRQEDRTRPVERGVKCPVCRSRVKSRVKIYVG